MGESPTSTSVIPKSVAALLKKTTKQQATASHPSTSVWVSANAGTGKTHVLKMRVLRLLLAGTPPEKILCLTYTNAAAAEMSTRVFEALAEWVTRDSATLQKEIGTLTGDVPDDSQLNFARTLFTTAIETPGGLKIQTFHGFCERLLQRFPLEADVPPGFSILDDEQADDLRRVAIDHVLRKSATHPNGDLGQALEQLVALAADENFDKLMRAALNSAAFQKHVERFNATSEKYDELDRALRKEFDLKPGLSETGLKEQMANILPKGTLKRLHQVFSTGKKTDKDRAVFYAGAAKSDHDNTRLAYLEQALLTKTDKTPIKNPMTKGLREAYPDLDEAVAQAQSTLHNLSLERQALRTISVTLALLRLARAVSDRYLTLKRQRAGLDYNDLIAKTVSLLKGEGATEWVLFKLDNGIDHVLVDESQDTSPQQWQIVETLAKEFFHGFGNKADIKRTIFAVGDEKQSIYSFQGAAPHLFSAKGKAFNTMADDAGEKFAPIDLTLSFRTVTPILEAVDAVFSNLQQTPGVGRPDTDIHHAVKRVGQAGLVELWPPEQPEHSENSDPWKPLDEKPVASPVVRLAERIADKIKFWLNAEEILKSQNRPIQPGDVLILVRKRRPFADPMVAALKARNIPVAGADRMVLTEQIVVQDLMALGDFLTLPEDDLALACALKSPMFSLDDDDLFKLAYDRGGTLWKALLERAKSDTRFVEAADMLRAWRKRADFTPPFEFFSRLLDRDGMRAKFLTHFGAEAADPIDELLNLALTYDEDAPPSLAGFITWLRTSNRQVKRDMDQGRNEVRVMTVHGAKGLEAPIVFLPDTCSTRKGGGDITLLPWGKSGQEDEKPDEASIQDTVPFVWPRKDFLKVPAVANLKERYENVQREEYHRLLYVAMTRARDRLYISGFLSAKSPSSGSWWTIINDRLSDRLTPNQDNQGREVLRLEATQTEHPEASGKTHTSIKSSEDLPNWFKSRAPTEAQLNIPIVPSRLAPYETDDDGDPVKKSSESLAPEEATEISQPSRAPKIFALGDETDFSTIEPTLKEPLPMPPTTLADGYRFLRGTITHALLQHLPSFPREDWRDAAKAFVGIRGALLSKRVRDSIVEETLSVLNQAEFQGLFSKTSRAEVTLAAEIANPQDKDGPSLKISGQIDRLVVEETHVHIVDYKTNRPPPQNADDVAESYLLQLAAYRLAIAQLYP